MKVENMLPSVTTRRPDPIAGTEKLSLPPGGYLAVDGTCRDRQRQLLPYRPVGLRLVSMVSEKDKARAPRRPLVAIDERMVPAQVKQIRGRHFGKTGTSERPPMRAVSPYGHILFTSGKAAE